MSYDLSISGKNYPNAAEAYVQQSTIKASSDSESQSLLQETPQNVKDLKLAELQGIKLPVGEEELVKAIEKANRALQGATTTLEFSIHQRTKEMMVKVL